MTNSLFHKMDKICRVDKGNVFFFFFLVSSKHSIRIEREYMKIYCLCSDVIKHVQLGVTRNLQEDLGIRQDQVAQFRLFAPEDLQGLVPQWDLLLPKGVQERNVNFRKTSM